MSKLTKASRELGKNEKILISSVTILAIVVVYWTLILSPLLDKMTPLEAEVQELKVKVANTNTLEVGIKAKEKQLEGLKSEYDEITKVLPKTDRYPQLIKEIREMAASENLEIKAQALGQPLIYTQNGQVQENQNNEVQQGLQTIAINLSITGDFTSALNLVGKLEADKRILDVQKVAVTDNGINLTLVYYIAGGNEKEDYDFNNGSYGKNNLFN